ncbi:GntR family transcriptional regulator [Sporosarcina sp. G11-34]|uniref:GntR family transcriptional regulator n=1 Tax=Sporosarcina sp. G11-34 TaxID=2849605 RepID=UPI0022A8FDD9|nr:GntR family transcriptional regulator [Sporosarcina sp. G11-34]MCZ2257601.1 GntR family transcriptional regulator [Sporosarcina sp. G11-34]
MNELPQTKRMSSSDIAYNELKQKIIELQYEPDSQLVEEELSTALNVSRTPLRQALYRLELEGLIVKQANGRMRVAPVSLMEVEEVYKVREVLEGLLAREATIHMTDEKIQQLEDVLVLMKLSAEQNRVKHTVRYSIEFHSVLYSLSTNQTVKRLMEQLNGSIERYRRISGYKNPEFKPIVPVQEHQEIFKLIQDGDPEKVEEEVRKHTIRKLAVAKETLELYFAKK